MSVETMSLIGTASTIWFVAFFVGVIAWAFWPSNRKAMDENSRIPLRDDR